MRLSCVLAIGLCSVAACGGDDDGSGPPDANFVEGTYTVNWGPYTAQPGEEGTKCVDLHLGNPGPIHVNEIHNNLGEASHHFIVYRKATAEAGYETPRDCVPFVGTLNPMNGAPLMITQKFDETLTLPPGVAFTLQQDQVVRLEMHYVNTGEEPVTIMASAEFTSTLTFEHEADFLFAGTPDIDLPPGPETQTVGPAFLPFVPSLAGSKVFAITGHTHTYGTAVRVANATSASDPGTEIYNPETFNWDEPETTRLDPPVIIPAAEDGGFRFSCDYVNTSGQRIGFGENADDEMCFFWLYYYPSKGAKVCFHTEQQGGHDVCCPTDETNADDAVLCALIQSYFP
jgi:hypothetical protein